METKNRASAEQLAILKHLNKTSVRYLAFGDFAINSYDNARTIGNIQLWIDPTAENFERTNKAIQNMYGNRSITQLDPATAIQSIPKKMLTLGSGEVRVSLYPVINGFKASDFDTIYQKSMENKAYLPTQPKTNQVLYKQLNINNLYQNIKASTSVHKGWNLETLERYANHQQIILEDMTTQQKLPISEQTRYKAGRMTRNFEEIKRSLDLEMVLQHYGYQINRKKSRPNDAWRIYHSGIADDKQRLAVAALKGYDTKFFVDLNDPIFRGDVFKFLEKMEHGNYRHIFQTIDSLMMQDGFAEKQKQIEPLREVNPQYFLKDTLLREQDLLQKYSISPLADTAYLEGRAISKDTLSLPEFEGRIKNVTFDTGVIKHTNTAFPMYAQDGNMTSLDIRNVGYKAFSEGERGEALWHSNRFYEVQQPFQTIAKSTEGTIYRLNSETVQFNVKQGEELQRYEIPIAEAKTHFKEITVNRIIVCESAIDAISIGQLSPADRHEKRLYLATGGQPGGKQMAFVQELMNRYPQSQMVVAQDGDNAGIRFAINYLGLSHPSENPQMKIKPYISYVSPVATALKSAESTEHLGTNRLNLELKYPMNVGESVAKIANEECIKTLIDDMNLFVKRFLFNNDPNDKEKRIQEFQRETLIDPNERTLITRTVIHFPNDTKLLTKALHHIAEANAQRQEQRLFQVLLPTRQQKDANELLMNRHGQALPDSHRMKLPQLPEIKHFEAIKQEIATEKQEPTGQKKLKVGV